MQVHDELVFEVPKEDVELMRENITRIMTEIVSLDVPLIVGIGVGDNWDMAH